MALCGGIIWGIFSEAHLHTFRLYFYQFLMVAFCPVISLVAAYYLAARDYPVWLRWMTIPTLLVSSSVLLVGLLSTTVMLRVR